VKKKLLRLFKFFGSFLLGALIGTAILFWVFIFIIFQTKKQYSGRVYPGVNLLSDSIAGKNRQELDDILAEVQTKTLDQKIVFIWKEDPQKKWEIEPQEIDFSVDTNAIIDEAMGLGRETDGGNYLGIYRLLVSPKNLELKYKFDQVKLTTIFNAMSLQINQAVQEPLFDFKQGKVINFKVSKEGRKIDREKIQQLLILTFSRLSPSKAVVNMELPVLVVKPHAESDLSNKMGINDLLGEGESFFLDSIPNRVHNIVLAASNLHGIVIPPGETFSFAEKIGDISQKTGYQRAYVIKSGKTVLDDGGGVCQVSTTLFRAALNAGLPIVERQAHAYRVGFYEQGSYPPGLDATVYPPNLDFKFKNDTPAYLLIQTEIDQAKKRLVFKFYGTSDGRKVEMQKPIILSQTPPPEPIYVDDPTLVVGTEKKFDSAHWGAKVVFTRKVWFSNGELKEEKTFISNYTPWPAVYFRGTKTQ